MRPAARRHPIARAVTGTLGFTLVELLVSLVIFGMLSAAGVALLSFSVRAQDAADEGLGKLAELRRAGALLTGDLAQAAPRIWRDEAGTARPAFAGGTGQDPILFSLVRRGWENLDDSGRSSLQRVHYRLSEGRLQRVAYPFVDGASAMEPVTLVSGVRGLRLRYRDKDGAWRERWNPARPTSLPVAVEMVIENDGGPTRQLFMVGAAP